MDLVQSHLKPHPPSINVDYVFLLYQLLHIWKEGLVDLLDFGRNPSPLVYLIHNFPPLREGL